MRRVGGKHLRGRRGVEWSGRELSIFLWTFSEYGAAGSSEGVVFV